MKCLPTQKLTCNFFSNFLHFSLLKQLNSYQLLCFRVFMATLKKCISSFLLFFIFDNHIKWSCLKRILINNHLFIIVLCYLVLSLIKEAHICSSKRKQVTTFYDTFYQTHGKKIFSYCWIVSPEFTPFGCSYLTEYPDILPQRCLFVEN